MRILHLVNSMDLCDGCARHLEILARHQQQRNEVKILAGRGDAVERLRGSGLDIEVQALLMHENRSLFRAFRAAWSVKAACSKWRPDLIHAHHFYAGNLARPAALVLRIPLVMTVHANIPTNGWLNHYPGRHLIAVSACTRDHILATSHRRSEEITAVVNAVEFSMPAMAPSPPLSHAIKAARAQGKIIVVFAGRLVVEKGVRVLLNALREIPGRDQLLCVIAGEGPMTKEIQESGLASIFIAGPVSSIEWLLSHSDILVLPSLGMEGLPMILLEAGLAGNAVVASAIDGVTEVVEDERTGLLVPPGQAQDLAVALHRLVESETLRSSLASALKERVKTRHDPDLHARLVEDVYARTLGGR